MIDSLRFAVEKVDVDMLVISGGAIDLWSRIIFGAPYRLLVH